MNTLSGNNKLWDSVFSANRECTGYPSAYIFGDMGVKTLNYKTNCIATKLKMEEVLNSSESFYACSLITHICLERFRKYHFFCLSEYTSHLMSYKFDKDLI